MEFILKDGSKISEIGIGGDRGNYPVGFLSWPGVMAVL
jgi:hypothetical protein